MKAMICILTSAFLILTILVAIANFQLLMQIGAIQLLGLGINLSLLLFYALVSLAVSGGLYVLITDAQESRLEIKKQRQVRLKVDQKFNARANFFKDLPLELQTWRFQVLNDKALEFIGSRLNSNL